MSPLNLGTDAHTVHCGLSLLVWILSQLTKNPLNIFEYIWIYVYWLFVPLYIIWMVVWKFESSLGQAHQTGQLRIDTIFRPQWEIKVAINWTMAEHSIAALKHNAPAGSAICKTVLLAVACYVGIIHYFSHHLFSCVLFVLLWMSYMETYWFCTGNIVACTDFCPFPPFLPGNIFACAKCLGYIYDLGWQPASYLLSSTVWTICSGCTIASRM